MRYIETRYVYMNVVYCLKLTSVSPVFTEALVAFKLHAARWCCTTPDAPVAAASAHVWTCVVRTAHRESDGSTLDTCWSRRLRFSARAVVMRILRHRLFNRRSGAFEVRRCRAKAAWTGALAIVR